MSDTISEPDLPQVTRLTARIAASYASAHNLSRPDLARLIGLIGQSLIRCGHADSAAAPAQPANPAVPIAQSIHDDYLVCLEDGRKLKLLRRHLRTTYGLSPEQYRERWGLPSTYPMVAPSYARRRRQVALEVGLGRRPSSETKQD